MSAYVTVRELFIIKETRLLELGDEFIDRCRQEVTFEEFVAQLSAGVVAHGQHVHGRLLRLFVGGVEVLGTVAIIVVE